MKRLRMLMVEQLCKLLVCIVVTKYYEATALNFFNYGTGAGDVQLPNTDDHATDVMTAEVPNVIFTRQSTLIRIETNGIITFGEQALRTYIPVNLGTSTSSPPIVAPFYANVDLRGTGEVYYRVKSNDPVIRQVDNLIHGLCLYEMGYTSRSIVIATWNRVGHWDRGTSQHNSFQCVVVTNGTSTFALFLYNEIQWTQADSPSDAITAQVGFFSGNGPYHRIPGTYSSHSETISTLLDSSNTGTNGMWAFKVSEPNVHDAACISGEVATLVPEMIVVHRGVTTEITCVAPRGSTDYKWLIDGVLFNPNASTNIYPNAKLLSNFTKIQFVNVSVGLNGSDISCNVIINHQRHTDHRRMLSSSIGTILVQGILGAVSDLSGFLRCPTFTISWMPPFALTLANTSYCVSIIDVSVLGLLVEKCGLETTNYTFIAQLAPTFVCDHNFSVSVIAHNPAGMGKSAAVTVRWLTESSNTANRVALARGIYAAAVAGSLLVIIPCIVIVAIQLHRKRSRYQPQHQPENQPQRAISKPAGVKFKKETKEAKNKLEYNPHANVQIEFSYSNSELSIYSESDYTDNNSSVTSTEVTSTYTDSF